MAFDEFTCSEAEEKLRLMTLCLVNPNKSTNEHLIFHQTNSPIRPISDLAGGCCHDRKVKQVFVCLLQKSVVFLIVTAYHKLEQPRGGGTALQAELSPCFASLLMQVLHLQYPNIDQLRLFLFSTVGCYSHLDY